MSRHVSNDLKARARALAAQQGIPYSAALARLRSSRTTAEAPTDTPADRPSRWLLPEYLYVDFPPIDLGGARPCDECDGSALDGRTFAQESDGGRPPLLVEVVCSKCEGCGRAEHLEDGCGHPHTDPDMDDGLFDEDEDEETPCYSCAGREFNYVQGVLADEEGEPVEVIYLRMPCGCTADRMRVILGDLIEVAG